MMKRMVWPVVLVGLLLMAAVVWYGLSLNSNNAVSKFSATASAVAAVGGFLAFVVLVFYTKETYHLRIATEKQLQSQHQIQEVQVKLSLFDKRFLVYVSLRRFLNRLPELGKNNFDAAQLMQDTNQAEFLFKPDIAAFLEEVFKKAHRYQSHIEQAERASRLGMGLPPVPDNLEADFSWLFSEAPKLARQKFEAYLDCTEDEV